MDEQSDGTSGRHFALSKWLFLAAAGFLIYGLYCIASYGPGLARLNAVKAGPEEHFQTLPKEKQVSAQGQAGAFLIRTMNGLTNFARYYAITEIVIVLLISATLFFVALKFRKRQGIARSDPPYVKKG